MAKNSKRKRKPGPSATGPVPPRPKKVSGPRQSEVQRAAHLKVERRARLRRAGFTAVVVLLLVSVAGALLVLDRRRDDQLTARLTAGTCEVDTESDPTRAQGQNHVPTPRFAIDPPAGGDHAGSSARAGVYGGGSAPDDGRLVHSLEHGYVVAWYRPGLPPDQLKELSDFQRQHDEDVIVVERSDLRVPIAATAWGRRMLCQQVEAQALQRFVDAHVGNGPEDQPRG